MTELLIRTVVMGYVSRVLRRRGTRSPEQSYATMPLADATAFTLPSLYIGQDQYTAERRARLVGEALCTQEATR